MCLLLLLCDVSVSFVCVFCLYLLSVCLSLLICVQLICLLIYSKLAPTPQQPIDTDTTAQHCLRLCHRHRLHLCHCHCHRRRNAVKAKCRAPLAYDRQRCTAGTPTAAYATTSYYAPHHAHACLLLQSSVCARDKTVTCYLDADQGTCSGHHRLQFRQSARCAITTNPAETSVQCQRCGGCHSGRCQCGHQSTGTQLLAR